MRFLRWDSIRNKELCHLMNNSRTGVRAVGQNAFCQFTHKRCITVNACRQTLKNFQVCLHGTPYYLTPVTCNYCYNFAFILMEKSNDNYVSGDIGCPKKNCRFAFSVLPRPLRIAPGSCLGRIHGFYHKTA